MLMQSKARILTFHEFKSLEGPGRVERAIVYDNRSKEELVLVVDEVLVNIGFINSLGPIQEWGLELAGGQIRVDSTMQTSRRGIFAADDITSYAGKLKLIATGFAEACTAVHFAKTYLDPGARAFPGHSSELVR
jgi:ferredoxin/flavodoxin---NADP+ reductase